MASRRKPKLLAQGKPRTLGGSAGAWRVRLHAPEAGRISDAVTCFSGTKIRVAGELFGLSESASLQQVLNAQEAERQRRADLAARQPDTKTSPGGTTPCRLRTGYSSTP